MSLISRRERDDLDGDGQVEHGRPPTVLHGGVQQEDVQGGGGRAGAILRTVGERESQLRLFADSTTDEVLNELMTMEINKKVSWCDHPTIIHRQVEADRIDRERLENTMAFKRRYLTDRQFQEARLEKLASHAEKKRLTETRLTELLPTNRNTFP